MPTILDVMPEHTYRRMMTPVTEAMLAGLGDVVRCPNAAQLTEDVYADLWARADAVLSGWGVRPPTIATLERAAGLKVISHTAGTVRMFPREAIERGVVVTTARSAIARTVAEFCLTSACVMLRRMPAYIQSQADASSGKSRPAGKQPGVTLFNKTVGLVGYGCVGRAFRALLAPFGCRVLVYDPNLAAGDLAGEDVIPTDLDELLRDSLVVSLHAPDISSTYRMVGARELSLMVDGAVLINAARGRIVDTDALTEALRTGRLSAALDVSDPEPLPDEHPLRAMPNVVCTPHAAGPTEDDLETMTRTAIADMARVLRGEPAIYAVSLAAYDAMSF